jgi:hypothetical protein
MDSAAVLAYLDTLSPAELRQHKDLIAETLKRNTEIVEGYERTEKIIASVFQVLDLLALSRMEPRGSA